MQAMTPCRRKLLMQMKSALPKERANKESRGSNEMQLADNLEALPGAVAYRAALVLLLGL